MCHSQLKAFDKGTFGNNIRHFLVYMEFCDKLGVRCFPLEPEKSALFVTYLDNGNHNAKTIHNYHSSVRTIARLMGVTVQKHKFPDILLVLKGIQKERLTLPKIAHPIMPEILPKIREILNLSEPKHMVMWALFLTSFFLMLRKSNVCHMSGTKPNYLLRKHLNIKRKYLLIHIFWTKTLPCKKNPGDAIIIYARLFAVPSMGCEEHVEISFSKGR